MRNESLDLINELSAGDIRFLEMLGAPQGDILGVNHDPINKVGCEQPKLKTYSAADLPGMNLATTKFIVEDFLPVGLAILAAPPKRGKSWLALDLCLRVALGQPFLNFPTVWGDVLYLDLESRENRLYERLKRIYNKSLPHNLRITHSAPNLDGGLIAALTEWVDSSERPRLIVIDTLVKIRGRNERGENAYERDSRILGGLQSLAQSRGIAILLIHHLRKSAPDGGDPYERVSGSMGIVGISDSVYLLLGNRNESEVTLSASGRDIDSMDLLLAFDSGRWTLIADDAKAIYEAHEFENSLAVFAVRTLLSRHPGGWKGTATDILSVLLESGISIAAETTAKQIACEVSKHSARLRDEGIGVTRTTKDGRTVWKLSHIDP